MKTYKGIKIGLFVIPRVFIADVTPLVVALPSCRKILLFRKTGKECGKNYRGRVRGGGVGGGLSFGSFVSLFLTLTIITFIIKNVVDS